MLSRLVFNCADGTIQLGTDKIDDRNLRSFILRDLIEAEPRMVAKLYIDQKTEPHFL